jgi:hypothetical protein
VSKSDNHRVSAQARGLLPATVCPRDEGDDMTTAPHVSKAEIVATLRSRGLDARADWVDRELPEFVDTHRNAALLRTLDIEPASHPPTRPPTSGAAARVSMSTPETRVRDRDAAGRPRNARPRDELGRPLAHDAAGVTEVPDDLALPPDQSLAKAQLLLDAGRAFHAHEVLEGTWKTATESERELWRGLAQLAVGLTHVRRGNAFGAVQLLGRAAQRIDGYADDPPHGIAAARLAGWARALVARIEQNGLATLTQDDLTAQLRT